MKLVLVGGFLGSGKTTAIVGACQQLMLEHKKVAVITNDQGEQQVDSAFVKSFDIADKEVINGCFCCNYDQLDGHIASLTEKDQPDIIFAESVGSCTDLIATIAKPLNKFRPEIEVVISIFADADLLASLFEGRSMFLEESVRYIYKKQLEEADLLIINKSDLLTSTQLIAVDALLKSEYPGKTILHQNSLIQKDISEWIKRLQQFTSSAKRRSIEVDYDVYGEGESKLAWLDKRIEVNTTHEDAVLVSSHIISAIFNQIQEHHFTIGHLKFFMESEEWSEKISFTSTSSQADIKLTEHKTNCVTLLINARVQTEPDNLERIVNNAIAKTEQVYGCSIVHDKLASFKPGYPTPTHRM